MADNFQVNIPTTSGNTFAADDIGGVHHQRVKVQHGADGSATDVSSASPLPVGDAGGSLTVDGTVAITGSVAVTDNSASLTVDNAALSVVGGGAESTALRVTVASDSTGVLSVDDNGATLSIDDGGGIITVDGTVAVSGTVTVSGAVTNAGTFAVQESGAALTALQLIDDTVATTASAITAKGVAVAGTDGTNARILKTDSGGELQVDVLSSALPSGAATSAKQDTEIASLAGIDASLNTIETVVSTDGITTTTSSPGVIIHGDNSGTAKVIAVNSSGQMSIGTIAGTITPGTASANLGKAEDVAHGTGNVGIEILAVRRDTPVVGSDTDGDYSTVNVDANGRVYVNVHDGGNSITVDNGGTFAVQVDGNALTALQLIDDTIFADDVAFTPATSKVGAVGCFADETSPDSVDEGDVGIPRMTLDRMQIVTTRPSATGEGLAIFRSIDLDETEEDVKTSPGKLYGWFMFNAAATTHYVKLYNLTAANTTVGSSTPIMTIPIPAGAAANVEFTNGILFDTALCAAATTGIADADTGAPAASAVTVNLLYK
jgi:hypothetical protein